jgi:hypothetical protein
MAHKGIFLFLYLLGPSLAVVYSVQDNLTSYTGAGFIRDGSSGKMDSNQWIIA